MNRKETKTNYDELIRRVKYHAQEVTKTKAGLYKAQVNPEIMRRQSYQGKMAEWAVYYYLKRIGLQPLGTPVMEVLRRPNWEPDLQTEKYKIAVKSCPSWNVDKVHAYSWTFQAGEKRKDPILQVERNDYIVFFVMCLSDTSYEIYGTATTKRLKQSGAYIFEDGVDKASLKGEKLYVKANKTDAIKPIRKIVRFE